MPPDAFFIFTVVIVFLLAAGGKATADSSGASPEATLLIIPAQPGVVQLAFDLAKMRKITIVAFKVREDKPVLYAWRENEWQYLAFSDFSSLRFVTAPPGMAMVIGDGATVPKSLLKGLRWPCNIERLPTLNPAGLINGMDPYFKFSSRERKQLAESCNLKLKEELAAKPEQDTVSSSVPSVITAAPVSGRRMQDAVNQMPDTAEFRGASGSSGSEPSSLRSPEAARARTEAGPAPAKVPAALKVGTKAKSQEPPAKNDELCIDIGEDEYIQFILIKSLAIRVGRHEITNAQYERFDRAHDPKRYYEHVIDLPDQPVVMVSWEDANNYCGWLNRNFRSQIPPGLTFRLPTESEWVACAKCGVERTYPWGDKWPPPNSFNYRGTEGSSFFYNIFHNEKFIRGHDDGFVVAAPVAKSGVNEWGLYGLGGNVWEWCQDWFDNTKKTRAVRGAGWNNHEREIIAISNRADGLPEKCNVMIGFRVVIAPK